MFFALYSKFISNIKSLIDEEITNKNLLCFDYRPKFEKIDEIENLCKNILSNLLLNDNLSEFLAKHFYENERKELFNLYEYFNNCFKMDNRMHTNSFLNLIKLIKFPHFNEHLITLSIKYCLKLIESFTINYDDKFHGIDLINCIIEKTSKSDLKANNRTLLLLNTIERFVYDKDSIEFIYKLYKTQLSILDIHETKYTVNEHDYNLHSKYLNNLFNSCLMCSNLSFKIVYFVILKRFLQQMNSYAIRYLKKIFDILLNDTIDYMKSNIDFKFNFILIKLIFNIIEMCAIKFEMRIHQHARIIIQFLIKFIYYTCLDYNDEDVSMIASEVLLEDFIKFYSDDSSLHENDKYFCLKYCLKLLIVYIFTNEKVKEREYSQFLELKLINSNKLFKLFIEFISKEIDKSFE